MIRSILIFGFVSAISAQCSYKDGSFSVNWTVSDGRVNLDVENVDFERDNWAGIGFGTSKDDMDLYILSVFTDKDSASNSEIKGFIGQTTSQGQTLVNMKGSTNSYSFSFYELGGDPGVLSVSADRPLKAEYPYGKDISGCTQWNFFNKVPTGKDKTINPKTATSKKMTVCPEKCVSRK